MCANLTQQTRANILALIGASIPELPTLPHSIITRVKGLTPKEHYSVQSYIGVYGPLGMAHVLLGHLAKLTISGKLSAYWLSDITGLELYKLPNHPLTIPCSSPKINVERGKFYSSPKIFRTCKVFYVPSLTPREFSYHGVDLKNHDLIESPFDTGTRVTDPHQISLLSVGRNKGPGWTHQPYAHHLINRSFTSFGELLEPAVASDTMKFGQELIAVNRVNFEQYNSTMTPRALDLCKQLLSYWEECAKRIMSASSTLEQK